MCAKVCHFDHFDVKAIAETIHLHRILYIELLVRDIERGESFVRVVAQALCIFNRQFLCADFEQSFLVLHGASCSSVDNWIGTS